MASLNPLRVVACGRRAGPDPKDDFLDLDFRVGWL